MLENAKAETKYYNKVPSISRTQHTRVQPTTYNTDIFTPTIENQESQTKTHMTWLVAA